MADTAAPTPAPAAPKHLTAIGCLGLIVLLAVVVGACSLMLPKASPTSMIGIGDQGHLRSTSTATVAVGTSSEVLEAAVQAAARKDTIGFRQIMFGSQVVWVNNGTRVQVIEFGPAFGDMRKVRILDGPRAGQAGWVFDYDLGP